MSEEHKRKISESMEGNLNALVHGKRSVQIQQFAAVQCEEEVCSLYRSCPSRVVGGKSICSLRTELAVLAGRVVQDTGDDTYWNFEPLMELLKSVNITNVHRFTQAVSAELDTGLIGDEAVTRLSREVFQEVVTIGKAVGVFVSSSGTTVDARSIHFHSQEQQDVQEKMQTWIDALSEERYLALLSGEVSAKGEWYRHLAELADEDPATYLGWEMREREQERLATWEKRAIHAG